MIVEFVDCEGGPSLSAGRKISDDNELLQLFSSLQFRTPFFFKLKGENGFSLDIGLGYGLGCVQHSRDSGDPPYMMAVNVAENRSDEYLEFVMGGTSEFGSITPPVLQQASMDALIAQRSRWASTRPVRFAMLFSSN